MVLQISCHEYIHSEQNRKTLGWRGAWDTYIQRNVRECVNRPEIFVFPHKVARSQKCSVAVYSTLLCILSSMIFSSPFPGSPAPRKSQSLFWVSFRVVHNRFNLFRHATTILVKKLFSTLLDCWFPLLSLVPPQAPQYTTPRSVSVRRFLCQPTNLLRILRWLPTI